DRFHLVNTTYGRDFGDTLLQEVSERLVRVLRPNDIIARVGVDQFLILLHDIKDSSDAFRVAQRVENQLESPFTIDAHDVFTTASIGIVTSAGKHKTNEDYIRAAETAMDRAKSGGGGSYKLFDERLHDRAVSRLRMENDLRAALSGDQLSLDFQPVLDLDTYRIAGFEALVRWTHPERGRIPPGLFIPFAEEIGLIVPIGEWVLNAACRQAVEWAKHYPKSPPIPISVNISGRQFQSVDVGELVEKTAREHNLPFNLLKVEITETAVMEDTERGQAVVKHLRDLGVQVQLDDFGTGYSSLNQLHKLGVDALKIDRSFVDGAPSSGERTAILRAIVQLGKDLGLKVIAEGIETYDELMLLRRLQCDFGQGYLFSKPVPEDQVGALLDGERIATGAGSLAY
ncbi:MAG: bifunctional diguanylate cyclase/phosphodiesterase, partial [Gemmatimonadota bacterium]|nr:bifunctional diguanylate cyclase/phosphodiesterase [Gemmatimonadota bacterium]